MDSTVSTSSIAETLRDAAQQLTGISETPRLDAELLMAHALGIDRGQMLLHNMQSATPTLFGPFLLRRIANEPVAYIVGHTEFWSLPFKVTPDVLIPRNDSETLIEAALKECENNPPGKILDLGTGSGALICAALREWPKAQGLAIDASAAALEVARSNLHALGLSDRCRLMHQSWREDDWIQALAGPFDLILCNPPYVEADAKLAPQVRDYEPYRALFAAGNGLTEYEYLIPQMEQLASQNGVMIFEIGINQLPPVKAIATSNNLQSQYYYDLSSVARAVSMRVSIPAAE